jgi:hypothetical protein
MNVYIYTDKEGWVPWENTIAYYPLTDNFNDESWNWYNLTNSWWSITTYGWVKCAYYSWSTSVYSINTSVSVWATRTLNCWCYLPNVLSVDVPVIFTWRANVAQSQMALWYGRNTGYASLSDYYQVWINGSVNLAWKWVNLIWVNEWASMKLYVNGTLVNSATRSYSTINSVNIKIAWPAGAWSQYFKWYVNNVIVENKARTAQEIADYYNQTKSNYWL